MSQESPLRQERGERLVSIEGQSIAVAYHPDGETWYVTASSVPGLEAQAADLDTLLDDLPQLIRQAMLP